MSEELCQAVRQHGAGLYRIAWRILGHADDVEDVLQDVFLEAFQFSRREEAGCWLALLKTLSVRRSLDRLRKRRFTVSGVEDLGLASLEDSPVDLAIGRELQLRLRQSLTQLSSRQAEVFCLRYFDDLSNSEIAATLRVSPASVATALHKSRMKLSELLSDELTQGEKDGH